MGMFEQTPRARNFLVTFLIVTLFLMSLGHSLVLSGIFGFGAGFVIAGSQKPLSRR